MQEDLQRLELEAREVEPRGISESNFRHEREPSLSIYSHTPDRPDKVPGASNSNADTDADIRAYQTLANETRAEQLDSMGWDAPSFSPFPKITGDNIPPADDEKEKILWKARAHVLHSQNVSMQITWARDVLTWAEVSMDAAIRESSERSGRPATPRIEHELRVDALNIIKYLASQDHPDALYLQAKWVEFGKFGERIDKREAYTGYKRAAELGNARSEYRMGMLFEQSNDMSKAKEHYYRGMSLKDSAALYRMSMMSLLGQHGESKDYQVGLERIRAAADSADEDAPQGSYVYGMLLGRDLPDINVPDGLISYSVETAKMYIEKAAYLGFAKAQLKMGQAYELCQLGCDFNPSFSLHYYGLAAKQGLPEAALGVSRWFLFGYEGVFKKNEELAFKYAHEAATAKLPTGEFAMGYYHEIGIHVNKSVAEARRWYQLAADHGNKDALGRLDSLDQDKSLSKQDHETTTLTRIKSQHGSQRGQRPERFKQPSQQMPTLSEGSGPPTPVTENSSVPLPKQAVSGGPSPRVSPLPSPGMRPTIVTDHANFPDPSRASVVGLDRLPAFNIRLDTGGAAGQPMRPQSAAPYPEDDRPKPLNMSRPKSTAPYPEDDTRPSQSQFKPGLIPSHGPQADRPMSAFGIRTQTGGPRPMPGSQAAGNLYPASQAPPHGVGRGRVASMGWEPQGPGGYQQASSGPVAHAPYSNNDMHARPASAQPYPTGGPAGNRLQKPPPNQPYGGPVGGPPPQHQGGIPPGGVDPGRNYGPRISSRPVSEVPLQHTPYNEPSQGVHGHDRYSRVPGGPHGHPERLGSLPPQQDHMQSRVPIGHPQGSVGLAGPVRPPAGRVGTAPPGQFQGQRPDQHSASPAPSTASAPAKPSKAPPGKGPATFEDMGIPQGKQDGDCVSSSNPPVLGS